MYTCNEFVKLKNIKLKQELKNIDNIYIPLMSILI